MAAGLAILGVAAAAAGDGAEPPGADEALDVSGRVRLESAVGTAAGAGQKLEWLFEPRAEYRLGPATDLVAIGRARVDALDELEPGSPAQSTVSPLSRRALLGDDVELELRELYLETSLDRARLNVGKQQIVWGQADGLKVLDVVDPQDFREFILEDFADSRIPLWALNAQMPVDPLAVQFLWVPDPSAHELPEPGATYAFTSPRLVPRPPPGVLVHQQPPDPPGRVLADSDVGARVSTFWQGWDLAAHYLYHYDDFPVFERRPAMVGGVPGLLVTPRYRRNHLAGGTASRALGPMTVRGEMGTFLDRAFSTPDPADADGIAAEDELVYVLGLDWFGFAESLVSFQLFQSLILDDDPNLARDRVETTLSLLLRHEMLNDTLVLETLWLHGAERGDGLVRPKVRYALDDHTGLWLGLDLFYGGGGGLFGQFDANDRVVMGVEWTF